MSQLTKEERRRLAELRRRQRARALKVALVGLSIASISAVAVLMWQG